MVCLLFYFVIRLVCCFDLSWLICFVILFVYCLVLVGFWCGFGCCMVIVFVLFGFGVSGIAVNGFECAVPFVVDCVIVLVGCFRVGCGLDCG